VLIVVDNGEHLVAACATVVDRLLRSCPNLRILARSQQPLGVAGETTWRGPTAAAEDAERLFVERALAAEPDLVLANRSESAVAEVCQRLDGIALAIEFAAARVSVLAPEHIALRLPDRFNLLTVGSRTAPQRQQTPPAHTRLELKGWACGKGGCASRSAPEAVRSLHGASDVSV
jgi:predicted ATPase